MQILNPPVSSAASVLTGDADPLGSALRLTPKVWQAEKETRDEALQRDGEEEIKPCWSEPVAAIGSEFRMQRFREEESSGCSAPFKKRRRRKASRDDG